MEQDYINDITPATPDEVDIYKHDDQSVEDLEMSKEVVFKKAFIEP